MKPHHVGCLVIILFPCASGLFTGGIKTPGFTSHGRNGCKSASLQAELTLQSELDAVDLGACHGMLHASGVRCLSDIKALTASMMTDMKAKDKDRRNLELVIGGMTSSSNVIPELSCSVDGAFGRRSPAFIPGSGTTVPIHDFGMETICAEHDIFKGRLFTEEQCMQMSRMAEYHAYNTENDDGWTNKTYTLTAQHLLCKDVPGLLSLTNNVFQQLIRELYPLLGGRIRKGTICFENSGEPHLVKYNGEAKGTELHKDNSEYVYVTVNCVLSNSDDFDGGGTYIKVIDRTIHLQQGEMLIHLGNLEHAGVDITSGVRRLMIAFLACEWEDGELNKAKLEEARDYVRPRAGESPPAFLF
jgi:hypothetical protein